MSETLKELIGWGLAAIGIIAFIGMCVAKTLDENYGPDSTEKKNK